MSFSDGFSFYYKTVLDLTSFISYALLSFGLCILEWPKAYNKKEIIKLVLIFVISYGTCILFSSLMFAISATIQVMAIMQMIYALTLPIMVFAYSMIFFKGRKLHRALKSIILISSIAVVEVLSKNTGFLFGTVSNNLFAAVAIARSAPFIFFTGVCYLVYRIDINRYRNLSNEMVIIISVLSALLITASIYEQASSSQEISTVVLLSCLDIVLLFVLNFSYYTTYKNIENRHRITNLEVQKTLEDAERMSIAIDQNNREELEKLRHDIKNQFSYLDIMLQQNNLLCTF